MAFDWRSKYASVPHPGYEDLRVVVKLRDSEHPIWITRRKVGGVRNSPGVKYTLASAKENLYYWTHVRPDLGPGEAVIEAMRKAIEVVTAEQRGTEDGNQD